MPQQYDPEKDPHFYKPSFTRAEAEEILAWFGERADRLPQTLTLNTSTVSDNLPYTVKSLSNVVRLHLDGLDATFSSYLSHLLLIRQRLTEQGID